MYIFCCSHDRETVCEEVKQNKNYNNVLWRKVLCENTLFPASFFVHGDATDTGSKQQEYFLMLLREMPFIS